MAEVGGSGLDGAGPEGAGPEGPDLDGTVAWWEVLAETEDRLAAVGLPSREARWIVEEASGATSAVELDGLATVRGMARHDAMVERRLAGGSTYWAAGPSGPLT